MGDWIFDPSMMTAVFLGCLGMFLGLAGLAVVLDALTRMIGGGRGGE